MDDRTPKLNLASIDNINTVNISGFKKEFVLDNNLFAPSLREIKKGEDKSKNLAVSPNGK
jgi:hypothetical protein